MARNISRKSNPFAKNNKNLTYSCSTYLSDTINLFLIRLGDVEGAGVGQGDGCGALQGCVYGQLTEAVVDARNLAVHGPTRYNAHLQETAQDAGDQTGLM